ncbi:MFS transporter small subunit [Nocardioides panacisoli]|nr:hypothetical protein [Nocardioides panacisoli]
MQAEHQSDHTARIAISWALVSIPLAYGLYNAIQAAAQLFTG